MITFDDILHLLYYFRLNYKISIVINPIDLNPRLGYYRLRLNKIGLDRITSVRVATDWIDPLMPHSKRINKEPLAHEKFEM